VSIFGHVEAYPLAWPVGWPRTAEDDRKRATFCRRVKSEKYSWTVKEQLTVAGGLARLRPELDRLGATDLIISSNIPVRQDGLPYSKVREPEDPGVAVYFRLLGAPHTLACDRWDRVADNLAAIAMHVEALRGMDRWGVGNIAQAFAGYKALPAASPVKPWWEVLGFPKRPHLPGWEAEVKRRYLKAIAAAHPDRGGNANDAAELNAAWEQAQRELGA